MSRSVEKVIFLCDEMSWGRMGLVPLACMAALAASGRVWAEELALRGFVRDAKTRSPVSGAEVSVSGARSRSDQVTDDAGFFHLSLPGVGGGTVVRLRVEKEGYVVLDRNVSASEGLALDLAMVPSVTATAPDAAPSVMAAYLEQLQSPSPHLRAAAATAIGRRGSADKVAVRALGRAMLDPDVRVRLAAINAIRDGKLFAPALLPTLVTRFHDPDEETTLSALNCVGAFGARARSVVPDLLEVTSQSCAGFCREAVHALVAIGEHEDPRLRRAFVDTLLYGGFARNPDLRAAAERHPDLLLSQLSYLSDVLAKETDLRTGADQRRAIEILAAPGAPGRKILLAQADQPHRRDSLRQTTYLVAWILQDARARDEIERGRPLDILLSDLRAALTSPDRTIDPYGQGDPYPFLLRTASDPITTHLLAAIALFGLGADPEGEPKAWRVLEDALREKLQPSWNATVRDSERGFVLDVVPAFSPAARKRSSLSWNAWPATPAKASRPISVVRAAPPSSADEWGLCECPRVHVTRLPSNSGAAAWIIPTTASLTARTRGLLRTAWLVTTHRG